ncbi:MAG: methionyl-tRNA formyltransferase, partial [Clostridia bacterium]|nr:methionyl-tRNA formyltransferase [Clostridia bacterium]
IDILPDENAGELFDRLSELGGEAIVEALELIESGKAIFIPQDESKATHYPMISKEDGLIDWNLSAEDIFNKMRGFTPWPSAFTYLDGKLFKILGSKVYDGDLPIELPAGGVYATKNSAYVKCGIGALQLLQVQLEGKKAMNITSFMTSGKLKSETVLGR